MAISTSISPQRSFYADVLHVPGVAAPRPRWMCLTCSWAKNSSQKQQQQPMLTQQAVLQTWVDFFLVCFLFFLERTTHSKAVQTAALARCCSTSSFVSAQWERCSFITAWDLHPRCRCDFGQMYRVSAKQIELRGPWGKKRCRIYGGV